MYNKLKFSKKYFSFTLDHLTIHTRKESVGKRRISEFCWHGSKRGKIVM